jgi:hypothetical protein
MPELPDAYEEDGWMVFEMDVSTLFAAPSISKEKHTCVALPAIGLCTCGRKGGAVVRIKFRSLDRIGMKQNILAGRSRSWASKEGRPVRKQVQKALVELVRKQNTPEQHRTGSGLSLCPSLRSDYWIPVAVKEGRAVRKQVQKTLAEPVRKQNTPEQSLVYLSVLSRK